MSIKESLWNIAAVISAVCAVVVTVSVVRGNGRNFVQPDLKPVPIADTTWSRLLSVGERIGPADADVTILVFSDFECPACRRFATSALKGVLSEYPSEAALVFRHWPLSYHRFARPAARASECAARQGKFLPLHDLLFEKQDSLGLKPWESFAVDAGVESVSDFASCLADPALDVRFDADTREVKELGGIGTPTVLVNGLRFPSAPDSSELSKAVKEALSSKVK